MSTNGGELEKGQTLDYMLESTLQDTKRPKAIILDDEKKGNIPKGSEISDALQKGGLSIEYHSDEDKFNERITHNSLFDYFFINPACATGLTSQESVDNLVQKILDKNKDSLIFLTPKRDETKEERVWACTTTLPGSTTFTGTFIEIPKSKLVALMESEF